MITPGRELSGGLIDKAERRYRVLAIRGIQFVTDAEGRRVAVQLDLREWGELWEDIYDNIVAEGREGEPTMPLAEFEAELRAEGLLNE
jgi:hypothetical protein